MKKRLVSLFVLSFIISQALSQELNTMSNLRSLHNIMSPDAASLGKYGTYNINYHTGTPNISVPLHQVNECGIQIPISISYDASGFVPNKNAGIVGLNWSLNAGGAITRIVNGVMDDKYDPNKENGSAQNGTDKGYIYALLHGQLQSYDPEYIRTNQYFSIMTLGPSGFQKESPKIDLAYEYIPDVFSFNFLGHNGKFFMDNTGKIRVVSDKRYSVDLIHLKPMYNFQYTLSSVLNSTNPVYSLNNTIISQIKMTSEDGYQFFFGGAFKDIEISFSYDAKENRYVNPKSGQINAWYLAKVITPENEIIYFQNKEYTDNDKKVIENLFNDKDGHWNNLMAGFLEIKYFRSHSIVSEEVHGTNTDQIYESTNTGTEIYKSLVKHVYLSSIETKLQKVKFNYEEKDYYNRFYKQPISGNGVSDVLVINKNYYTSKLSDIQIWDNINGPSLPFEETDLTSPFPTNKIISFNYDYRGNRMFLTGIDINVSTKYGFQYSNTNNLPDPLTTGVDIWGYFNGKDNSGLVGQPNIIYGTPGEYETDFSQPNANRLADPVYATYGILNTIIYPTGGKTEFTYENHRYRKALQRKVTAGIEPQWVPKTMDEIAGGLRISEIKNTPGSTTTFKYISDYDKNVNNPSSGLLTNEGVHVMYFHKPVSGGSGFVHASIKDNNIESASSYGESHVEYAEVIEINSEGYSKYKFSTHETNPDTYDLGSDSYKISAELSATNFNGQLKRIYKYSSRSSERGKLLKTELYNSSNNLVKSVENIYNVDPSRTANRTLGIYCPYDFRPEYYGKWIGLQQSFALYYYYDGLSKTIETYYNPGISAPLVNTTTFKYRNNIDPTIIEKTVTQSDGSVQNFSYKYVEDFAASGNVYYAMKEKFILSPLIEETTLVNNAVVRINKHNYSLFPGNLHKVASEKTINEKKLPGVEIPVLTVTAYTTNGLITEAYKNSDHFVSYIWDYKNTFPIAQATNATNLAVAYTSFEADGNGGWVFSPAGVTTNALAPTGKKTYNLSAADLYHAGISNSTHIVSYWSNGSPYTVTGTQLVKTGPSIRGWTYFEHTISGTTSVSISGNGMIDEVRLYSQGAMLKTYTYEPLVGITSQSDENGSVVYYDYDALGRLQHIRDGYRNIIKKYCYNFYNQIEECLPNTNPVWQSTGETRCKPCGLNASYFSNIQEHKEIDKNPLSQSYLNERWVEDGPSPNCNVSDWQNTGNLRCESYNSGGTTVNTGFQEQQQIDMNPCSPSYNESRWIDIGQNCTACSAPAYWQPTGVVSCQKDASGNNTGYQLVEEKDVAPCSLTYTSTRTKLVYNPSACPLPYLCSTSDCTGNDRKCINNECTVGNPVVTSRVWKKVLIDELYQWKWVCTWRYCFNDGTASQYYWETYSDIACTVQLCGLD